MRTIWKYSVPVTDAIRIKTKEPGWVVSVLANPDGRYILDVYVVVDPDKPDTTVDLRVFGTGHPVDADLFLATVRIGEMVWHVFEAEEDR